MGRPATNPNPQDLRPPQDSDEPPLLGTLEERPEYVEPQKPSHTYPQTNKVQTKEIVMTTPPPPSHPLEGQVQCEYVATTPVHHYQHPIFVQAQPSRYVVPQPGVPVYQAAPFVGTELWTTDLFDCLDDPNSAVIAFCFPCIPFGQIAEILDNGTTSCSSTGLIYGGVCCLYSFGYRTKLRLKYGLVESPASDLLTHCLCECCAVAQEYRELQNRGFDPALGWNGNVARQQQQQGVVAMTPPKPQMVMM